MDYTGNAIQNWFLKEIELFVYYVKRPLRGLLQEIPKSHLFSSWIENINYLTQPNLTLGEVRLDTAATPYKSRRTKPSLT